MKLNMIYYIGRLIYFTFLVTFIKNLNAKKKKKKTSFPVLLSVGFYLRQQIAKILHW